MALLLATGINATQQRLTLTEPLIAEPGDLFRIGDEAVEFGGYGRRAASRLVDPSHKTISVQRGVGTTTAASHLANAPVLRVVTSLVSGLTEPEPWAVAGGAPSGAAGGQLSGTYPNPSVASSHSGSTHASLVPTPATQEEMETGTEAAIRSMSPLRVAQGIAALAEGGIQVATVTLSSAQILALFTTPVQLVAAPGAGKVVKPISALAVLHAGATPYDATGVNGLYIGPDPGNADWLQLIADAEIALMESAVDAYSWFGAGTSGEGAALAAIENQALLIGFNSADPTAGNGTMDVTVHYILVDV